MGQERCKVCDRPMATNADWMGAPEYVPDDYRPELCWTKSQCDAHAVDWRRRALEAEARERWVPVGERLPRKRMRVLVWVRHIESFATYVDDGSFTGWLDDDNCQIYPSHWRPMPASPEVP